jgi:DNA-binding response OmpR family regulator
MAEPSATLLVVDDNEENREMLSRRLRKRGFDVLTAEGGRQALEMVRGPQTIDLILLDVMMPEMNGLEVLKTLRQMRSATELPVIMATARSDSEDVVEALELGANDYVTKPIDFPVVLARIQAQLRTKRAAPPTGPASPKDVVVGTVLADRYQLEAPLGAGAFGTVYRARHLDLDAPVAVKVLQASVAQKPEALARFRREGISACRIRHPNAVGVTDFGVTPGGVAFLVMEFLEGRSLRDVLDEAGALAPRRSAEILIPVCSVLADAHAAGIVHRDIKPSNIFLQSTPRGDVPKVLDFGIAKLVRDAAASDQITLEGVILGTPIYMAPERFQPGRPYDGRSDVYSVGVMLYQMLSGRLPFVGPEKDPLAVVRMHLTVPAPPILALRPDLPPTMAEVVMRTLQKDPEARPTAAELAQALAVSVGLETPLPERTAIAPPTDESSRGFAEAETIVTDSDAVPSAPKPDDDV